MARYTGPTCKLARREGTDLMLKSGQKEITKKCRLTSPPGGLRRGGGRKSDYHTHLREKQKLRRIYGVLERQFRRYYGMADRSAKSTGTVLLNILESRLDNVIYRMGFASTRAQARQMVTHKMVRVDGQQINIPSYQVAPGQTVTLIDRAKELLMVKEAVVRAQGRVLPTWLEIDFDNIRGVFKTYPEREDLAYEVDANLIVEYYSK